MIKTKQNQANKRNKNENKTNNIITKNGLISDKLNNLTSQNEPKYFNKQNNSINTSFIPHNQRYSVETRKLAKAIPGSNKIIDPSYEIEENDKVYLSTDQLSQLIKDVTETKTPVQEKAFISEPKKKKTKHEQKFPEPKNKGLINKINDIWNETSHKMSFHHLKVEDSCIDGREITVNNKRVINFGSCSYLGLEHRDELKQKSIEAIHRFGTQYSSSVTYMSLGMYSDLREKYKKIFGANVIIAPTTTLGHASCIPLIGDEYDLFLLDQQVHNSVQMGVQLAASKGTKVITLPHNNMKALESKIEKLQNEYRRIWYFCDGIYSMYGDSAPLNELEKLKNKYENLHLYIDDAHGTSWTGKNGCGYALNEIKNLDKTIVAASNNKAFAGAGGTLVIKDEEIYNTVSNFGQTLIFSGPIQPSSLGACLASADIHLSPEINKLQTKLKEKIQLRNELLHEYDIPFFEANTPISFVCVGSPRSLGTLFHKLYEDGFYTNCAVYPAVSKYKSGLRTTLTLKITDQDICDFVECVAHHLPTILKEENLTVNDIRSRFKLQEKTLAFNRR
tara:strand:+ start:95 stop:1780 length:1686 start_codon:yes stop_codon:yes gene_type:complete